MSVTYLNTLHFIIIWNLKVKPDIILKLWTLIFQTKLHITGKVGTFYFLSVNVIYHNVCFTYIHTVDPRYLKVQGTL